MLGLWISASHELPACSWSTHLPRTAQQVRSQPPWLCTCWGKQHASLASPGTAAKGVNPLGEWAALTLPRQPGVLTASRWLSGLREPEAVGVFWSLAGHIPGAEPGGTEGFAKPRDPRRDMADAFPARACGFPVRRGDKGLLGASSRRGSGRRRAQPAPHSHQC